MNSSRLTQLDWLVQSGFENHALNILLNNVLTKVIILSLEWVSISSKIAHLFNWIQFFLFQFLFWVKLRYISLNATYVGVMSKSLTMSKIITYVWGEQLSDRKIQRQEEMLLIFWVDFQNINAANSNIYVSILCPVSS